MSEITKCLLCKTNYNIITTFKRNKEDVYKSYKIVLCRECYKNMRQTLFHKGEELEKDDIIKYYEYVLNLEEGERNLFKRYRYSEYREMIADIETLGQRLKFKPDPINSHSNMRTTDEIFAEAEAFNN